jgi:hypothetical protein
MPATAICITASIRALRIGCTEKRIIGDGATEGKDNDSQVSKSEHKHAIQHVNTLTMVSQPLRGALAPQSAFDGSRSP